MSKSTHCIIPFIEILKQLNSSVRLKLASVTLWSKQLDGLPGGLLEHLQCLSLLWVLIAIQVVRMHPAVLTHM